MHMTSFFSLDPVAHKINSNYNPHTKQTANINIHRIVIFVWIFLFLSLQFNVIEASSFVTSSSVLISHSNTDTTNINNNKHKSRPNNLQPSIHRRNHQQLLSYSNTNFRLRMCQLLGMNCATPTDFVFSFKGFRQRGGITDKHSDGWGCMFYEGRGVRAFHDSAAASESPIADLMSNYPIKTLNMIAHIRYATAGAVALENVHPFQREMWGIVWCFAHNGDVPKFGKNRTHPWIGKTGGERTYNPVGDTDSEAVFCALLNSLKAQFKTLPTMPVLYDAIEEFCKEIVSGEEHTTILNFLLGVGEHVQFAYSWPGARPGSTCWNGLCYTVRKPPFKSAALADIDYAVDFGEVTTEKDCVAVIATAPLTNDEVWVEFKRGELVVFDEGLPHASVDVGLVEAKGHGLESKVLEKLPLPKAAADFYQWYGCNENENDSEQNVDLNFVI